ncbi:Anp1-domain-containing protein [Protomyces lactucae-debilis]|uniref:Anp1-domain-containing protein n=1 Tax=Protomyces lactucae-debilis TaxID=2754530 RepID=A0A1Y2FCB0_PROLT|nr:Anp1-domain-containing protein [Protomyces lactucae-debilis]ORY81553.1 Anp1-domain-containing protein [Protomyces lactucae-debilis]
MKKGSYHQGSGIQTNRFRINIDRFGGRQSIFRNSYVRIGAVCAFCLCSLFYVSGYGNTVAPAINLGFGGLMKDDPAIPSIRHFDLAQSIGSPRGWENGERVLFLSPLRDAAVHLPMFFSHLRNLSYPHHLIDLAFLVSDSKDNTMSELVALLDDLQADPDQTMHYGDITIIEKDFGQAIGQSFSDRHGFAAQGPRRKLMARARNWLLSATLKADHSWVYWRDVDVETAPATILEDLMRHDKDVIVPNVWRPLPDWLGGQQPYDLNSWQESETALQLAKTLDEDVVIVEGYAEFATWRPHLAYLRDPEGDPEEEMPIDGIGGVSILAKARVFRTGTHFPAFSFEKHAETEGFGKMSRRMGFSVVGLPHYVIWHLYEPSVDDIKHMEEMEAERVAKEAMAAAVAKEQAGVGAASAQWESDKQALGPAGAAMANKADKGSVAGESKQQEQQPLPPIMKDKERGSINGPLAHVGEEMAQQHEPGKAPVDGVSENGITPGSGESEKQ